MLVELRKVVPAFLRRVDIPDRGGAWSEYLGRTRDASASLAREILEAAPPEPRPEVTLTDHDPEGETKIVAAVLYPHSNLPDDELLALARRMGADERAQVLRSASGERTNRRHRPGRAFERTGYRFDVLCDYGAFRDLQRHRLMTIEWQELSPEHGFEVPVEVEEVGALDDWRRTMESSAELWSELRNLGSVAQYAVAMAYKVRFVMQMNAREAMHVIELRTTPQGHPTYRRVCQKMHSLIAEVHPAIAEAMSFVDHSGGKEGRLSAERRSERRRGEAGARS